MRISPVSISINEISSPPQIMNLRKVLAAYACHFFVYLLPRSVTHALRVSDRARNRSNTLLIEAQSW